MSMNGRITKNRKVNNYHNKKNIKCIELICNNTTGDSTMGKFMVEVPINDSVTQKNGLFLLNL